MKIKIIDLLNKIAKNEQLPKEVMYDGLIYEQRLSNDFYNIETKEYLTDKLVASAYLDKRLNDEVEIIEEDKTIKELQFDSEEKYITTITGTTNKMRNIDVTLASKINELVKEIKKMKED